jgi:sialate O-acetylesterase
MPFSLFPSKCDAFLFLLALASLAPTLAVADVKMPAIFGDHMVLQRDMSVPLWGTAAPGEMVTVTAGTDKGTATADKDGKWTVKLEKLAASTTPIDVTVAGKNTLTFHDVLVGDVWLCSGQSNMEFGIRAFMPPAEFEKISEPQIRIFGVPKWVASKPESDITTAPAGTLIGAWEVCSAETLTKSGEWSGFSATGFFFGKELHDFTHQPVGLIASSWGGTRIHSWTSLEMLKTMPEKVSAAKNAQDFQDHYDDIKKQYETVTAPQWTATLDKWKADNKAALDAFATQMAAWQEAAKAAAAQKQHAPPRPTAPKQPREPRDPLTDNQASAALFNGMISPLIPFGIDGVIWYQGEANSAEPGVYRAELPALVRDWRKHWNEGDFPFLVVQLPNFMQRRPDPSESTWAQMREIQYKIDAQLPKTGTAVTIDIGEAGNIHPADKLDVGKRLALVAEHVALGSTGVWSGPTFKSVAIQGNQVRVTFDNIGGGLTVGVAPEHFYTGARPPSTPPAPAADLDGFSIAGADGKFVWAKAKIDGNAVVVSADSVPSPVAVRYAWADNPACNLYNKEGLPASPFRTDDFAFGK